MDRYGNENVPRQDETEVTPENTGFNYDGFKYDSFQGIADHDDPFSDNVFSRWFSPSIAEDAQFQRENYMVDKANAFNEYMYEKALHDNSPLEQMKRAQEAGINVNLAAEGIMGNGNAVGTPMQAAQGSTAMNTNAESPFDIFGKIAQGINQTTQATNTLGELIGFGKKNKAEIRQIEKLADKAAEEADFTYWQKRQFRRTMQVMYDKAYADLDETYANIQNLKTLNDVYIQQKYNIAADTTLKSAQTGEIEENTKNLKYKNWEAEFKKQFAQTFGILLNDSDTAMLVEAFLKGKGSQIIDAFVEGLKNVAKELGSDIFTNNKEPNKTNLNVIPTEGDNPDYVKDPLISEENAKKTANTLKRNNLESKWYDMPKWKKDKLRKIGITNAKEYADWIEPELELLK